MQVESRGASDNLAHAAAAHCASCVFLNEISIAKSHTLHQNASQHNHSHHSNHNHNHNHINQSSHHLAASQQHNGNNNAAATLHSSGRLELGHLQQQQQQQPHQATTTTLAFAAPHSQALPSSNQYNLNSSDYSSSTYHIYDQISDLIIIKQQRMERKRQLARRRKLVFLGTLATLLIGCSIYIVMRLLASISSSSPIDTLDSRAATRMSSEQQLSSAAGIWPPPMQAPPSGARTSPPQHSSAAAARGSFDGAHWQQYLTTNNKGNISNQQLHLQPVQAATMALCSNRGTVILNAQGEPQWPCKCAHANFTGDRCELFVGSSPNSDPNSPKTSDSNSHAIARCLQHNCSGNGQCNSFGRCQCALGFVGNECEFRLASAQATGASNNNANNANAAFDLCALAQRPCLNGGVCGAWQAMCHCKPGFSGLQCEQPIAATLLDDEPAAQQRFAPSNSDQQQATSGASSGAQPNSKLAVQSTPTAAGNGLAQLMRRQFCNGNGHFDAQTRTCDCDLGFIGQSCAAQMNPADPSNAMATSATTTTNKQSKSVAGASSQSQQQQQVGGEQQQQKSKHANRCAAQSTETAAASTNSAKSSDNRCGSYGVFDCALNKCICQDGFTGDKCQHQHCSAQCLRNGQCVDGVCICRPGFYGKQCSLNGCPNNCSGRGQCIRQTLSSSPSPSMIMISAGSESVARATSASSDNAILQAEWRCQCQPGAIGEDCSQLIERQCDDNIDNDNDGLVDCADSECCADKVCQNSTLCMKSPDPLDILMRKQPSPPTSSFFQRMQFLIEKSQTYSNPKDFNDSTMASNYVDRASVIRGRVTYMKQGITGVKVSVAGHLGIGITLTRDGGFFDLMVNGGGAVLVEFRREPFAITQKAVRVPWNEIVLMDTVELALESQPETTATSSDTQSHSQQPSCLAHNYRLMRAIISTTQLANTKLKQNIASQQQPSGISRLSSHRMQQHFSDSNHTISLVYISSRSNEYMSTLSMQLTPEQINLVPSELSLVHVKVVVEGNLYEQTFEPQANLTFTYAWNRRNAYRQKSFGLSTAIVSVGYEYFDCQRIVWDTQHVQIAGHDLAISDIGNGWNLNVHHRYNYRDAILQRGDGQNFDLKTSKPRLVQPLMGDGYQRQAICPYCDSGSTSPQEQRLYRPQALVSAPDGSLYVGDANLVRRIESSERTVRTVLELSPARTPQRYSLALSPTDQRLYMIDPERAQVFWVRGASTSGQTAASELGATVSNQLANDTLSNGEDSLIAVIGSGTKCVWSSGADTDETEHLANCGDGQLARQAQLIDPKAMAFDTKGKIYLADGPNVREIEPSDGRIHTILGDFGQSAAASAKSQHQFPCTGEAIPMHKYVPKAPLDLAVNPIDETLHVLDDNVVYRVTPDKRVQVVAGQLGHCGAGKSARDVSEPFISATEYSLQSAQSIAFNQNGELFISEDDQKQALSRVLIVEPNSNSISSFAGLPIELGGAGSESSPNQQTSMAQQSLASDKLSNQLPRVVASTSSPTLNQLPSGGATLTLGSTAPGASSNPSIIGSVARANEHKFSSIEAIAVDPRGNLIVADKVQLRLLSIEPDLPQMNSQGEYELSSPDEPNELLIFNRFGHHISTREFVPSHSSSNLAMQSQSHGHLHHHHSNSASSSSSSSSASHYQSHPGPMSINQRPNLAQANSLINKYTFTYTVNTSLGQLVSVTIGSSGNKISIYREGPHHQVRHIETAFGGQCKLDISRTGQVHSSSTFGAARQPCCTCQAQDSKLLPASFVSSNPLFGHVSTAPARCDCVITQT